MPWKSDDATRHTKKADTPQKKRLWSAIADRLLAQGKDEATAVRTANGVVKKRSSPERVSLKGGRRY